MEELKNRHREHDRMTEREKRDREQDSTGGKKMIAMGSGREIWRKKKILRKRERKEEPASWTGGYS